MKPMAKSTKQLARELGLIRKRPLNVTAPGTSRKEQKSKQMFSHLIVLDFESTCWESDKTSPQEIIEFPAVLLNTNTGDIESEFHFYLQPSERPNLSDFCHQLTGIAQSQVDNGIPLSLCLRKFAGWVRKLREDKGIVCADDRTIGGVNSDTGKVAAFVTWSDWDLGVCLLYEAQRKQIMRPSCLDRWIDLRVTYRKFYSRRPDGLNGALKDLGIDFEGREHSGLDDARNTARLAWRMICDGCQMAITKTLKMNQLGKVERISSPPSTPTLASVQSARQDKGSSELYTKMKFVPKPITPFVIAKDSDNLTCSTVKKSEMEQPGLSERNLNVSVPLPKKSLSKKARVSWNTECVQDQQLKNVSNSDSISSEDVTIKHLSENCCQSKISSMSKIPVLNLSWCNGKKNQTVQEPQARHGESTKCDNDKYGNGKQLSVSSSSTTVPPGITSSKSPCIPLVNNSGDLQLRQNVTPPLATVSAVTVAATTPLTTSVSKEPFQQTTASFDCLSKSTSSVTSMCRVHEDNNRSNSEPAALLSRQPCTPAAQCHVVPVTNKTLKNSFTNTSLNCSTRTPPASNIYHSVSSNMRPTPPLCSCGHRSKRRVVQKQGPNVGRCFFTCSKSCAFNDKGKSGCRFFQWEFPNDKGTPKTSVGTSFKPVLQPITASQRSLGMRSIVTTRIK